MKMKTIVVLEVKELEVKYMTSLLGLSSIQLRIQRQIFSFIGRISDQIRLGKT